MSTGVYDVLREQVAQRIDQRRVDADRDPDAVQSLIAAAVDEYQRGAHAGESIPLVDPKAMRDRLWQAVVAFGPLTELLDDWDVEEIFIEGDRVAFIRAGGSVRPFEHPTTEAENRQIIERLLEGSERRLDATSAIQQARVLEGRARLTAVIPPVADRLSATIRKYTVAEETLSSLVARGSLSSAAAAFLWALAQVKASVVFAGPTGAGKTTALSAYLRAVPAEQCIRMVEEVRELKIPLSLHSSFYQASGFDMNGHRRYTLRDLIKVCLAQRVDVLCVGEVRGDEAVELPRAMNAGCGFACTVHADSARRTLAALLTAASKAPEKPSTESLRFAFAESIDVIVFVDRVTDPDGSSWRFCREIIAVGSATGGAEWTTEALYGLRGDQLEWTGTLPEEGVAERISRVLPAGVTLPLLMSGEWSPL